MKALESVACVVAVAVHVAVSERVASVAPAVVSVACLPGYDDAFSDDGYLAINKLNVILASVDSQVLEI